MRFAYCVFAASLALGAPAQPAAVNSTYTNPILPGWHSDPTCVFVPEQDNTFFCAVSTFLAFPGLPVYASKDLMNWKLVSSSFNRPSQFPDLGNYTGQQNGIFAPTLRYRNGTFYNVVVTVPLEGLIFTTTDPFDNDAWSDPIRFTPASIDADLFWDDDVDGQAYITYAGIQQSTIDLATGETSTPRYIWNGTGGPSPEGPHIYKKDGYYYLMIAEGGTELGHSEIIARSSAVSGPYEAYAGNPLLTNRNTSEYFQTVGHADLFQDAAGRWWGVALSTRSGPAWRNYPMGRETVLLAATWDEGAWPVLQPVRGRMDGWPLPPLTRDLPGTGPFADDPDEVDFAPGEPLPRNFLWWRFPTDGAYTVGPEERPGSLRLLPSRANLTGDAAFVPEEGITLVTRKQTDTLFAYSVDVEIEAEVEEEEAGVTVFLTQDQHLDLGIVLLPSDGSADLAPHLRFRVNGTGNNEGPTPETVVEAVPEAWLGQPLRLQIQAANDTHYTFSAGPSDESEEVKVISYAPATIVSGGTGPFTVVIELCYNSAGRDALYLLAAQM
ncbi:Glycoside hydrolase family 43 [Neofusicoccum parvum]|uniref:Glycoside hydrolase family 43 n=1 Tax=Neofusicoccum parvum TaxID=310453 RepID=A0ACB5RR88_9PEZI|nr:Glycoside hydrolase family 43 [Neofusicoccum parvum]